MSFQDRYLDPAAARAARAGSSSAALNMLAPDFNFAMPEPDQPKKKRKRGGLAGIWDRNKKIIKPLAAGAAGLLPGGAFVAPLLGAAMGGFDREGKGGVGFDLGQGAMGAATGALAGSGARGLKNLLMPGSMAGAGSAGIAPGATAGSVDPATGSMAANMMGGQAPGATPLPGMMPAGPAPAASVGATGGGRVMDGLSKVLGFAKDNPAAVGSALQGAGSVLGARMEQDAVRERLEFDRDREMEERRRRAFMAQLLIPMYFQQQEAMGLDSPPFL